MSKPSPSLDRQRTVFLDGARGWASVMVLLYHTFILLLGKKTAGFNNKYLAFPTDGALAVYIFFVISGFALALPYRVTPKQATLTTLALRRYVRLTIPILFSALAAYIVLKSGLMFNQRAAPLANNTDWLGVYYGFQPSLLGWAKFSFFDVYFNYDRASTYNHNLWTMNFELCGSFMIFAILSLIGRIRLRSLFYLLIAAFLYFETSFMLPFLIGLMLAELNASDWIKRHRTDLGMLFAGAICLLTAWYFSTNYRQIYNTPRYPSLVAGLVVLALTISRRISWVFETRFSVFLGRISFPLYLTHLIVICSLSSYVYVRLSASPISEGMLNTLVATTTIAASFLAACLFEPVEKLAIAASRRFSALLTKESAGLLSPES